MRDAEQDGREEDIEISAEGTRRTFVTFLQRKHMNTEGSVDLDENGKNALGKREGRQTLKQDRKAVHNGRNDRQTDRGARDGGTTDSTTKEALRKTAATIHVAPLKRIHQPPSTGWRQAPEQSNPNHNRIKHKQAHAH